MATTPTQIRIDTNVKKQAMKLFADLGIDMSTAVNIFLKQCIMHDGLPFSVERPKYSKTTIAAMEEGLRISRDSDSPAYDTMEELKAALED